MHLEQYLQRIGRRASPEPDLATLTDLHARHVRTIPFENLSSLLGEPVSLDIDALGEKLLASRRGGYCFEHNTLFGDVVETIGFEVRYLAARVVWNHADGVVNPRTHMALLVDVGGTRYLCDTGFGAVTLTAPLRFAPDVEQQTRFDRFRIRAIADAYVLEVRYDGCWRPMYEFDLQPQLPVDYEAMNHFVQTHADSPFTKTLMACRTDPDGRMTLRDNELRRYEGGALVRRRLIRSGKELAEVLRDSFGIGLPEHAGLPEVLDRVAAAPGK